MLLVDKKERETRRPPILHGILVLCQSREPFFSLTFLHFYYYDTHVVSSKKKRDVLFSFYHYYSRRTDVIVSNVNSSYEPTFNLGVNATLPSADLNRFR